MNELLLEGLAAVIAGMGSVFVILILISLIIGLFEYIDPINRKNKLASLQAKISKTKTDKELSHDKKDTSKIDLNLDGEEEARIVAAISVALATSLNTSVDKLQVKAIRRV